MLRLIMRHWRPILAGFAAALVAGTALPARAQTSVPDFFPGAATGTLHISMDLTGYGRTNMPNGVEWAGLTALRSFDIRLRMVDVGNGNVPIVPITGATGPGGGPLGMPPAMAAMEDEMAACNGNQACQIAVMTQLGKQLMESAAPPAEMDFTRFQNWATDRRVPCAEGSLSVNDDLQGVTIPPPNPAVAYRFQRVGLLKLPAGLESIIDNLCVAEMAFDTQTMVVSLRLPAGGLDVPVDLIGAQAFTDETVVELIEGVGKLELLDENVSSPSNLLGEAVIEKVGSASHNSGQVVAPLRAAISWSFVPD